MPSLILSIALGAAMSVGLYALFNRPRTTFKDLSVARSMVGGLPLLGSLAATYVGPGLSMGLVGQAFYYGWVYPALLSGYALQLLFVGVVIGPRLKRFYPDCCSLGDVMRQSVTVPSPAFIRVSGAFTVLIMTGVCAILIRISGLLVADLIGLPQLVGSALVTTVVASYIVAGGINASIKTDIAQLAFFSAAAAALAVLGLVATRHGAPHPPDAIEVAHSLTPAAMVGIFIAFTFGDMLQPPFFQRILAAKDVSAVKVGFLGCAVYLGIWFAVMGVVGILARDLLSPTTQPDDVLLSVAAILMGGIGHKVFLGAVVFIAVSSHDSVLNASSTVFVNDVLGSAYSRSTVRRQTLTTVGISVSALLLSSFFTSIMNGILFLASIWAPTMLVPILALIFLHQDDHSAAWVALVTGAASSLAWLFFGYADWIPPILFGTASSFVAFAASHHVAHRAHKVKA